MIDLQTAAEIVRPASKPRSLSALIAEAISVPTDLNKRAAIRHARNYKMAECLLMPEEIAALNRFRAEVV